MSANFTLALSNPKVTTGPSNVVYTDLAGGNALDLRIANRYGFDVTFGSGSTGVYLELEISANVLDEAAAAKLSVGAPWQVASHTPPDGGGEAGNFAFKLQPPQGGVELRNGGSVTIALHDLEPSAVGTALLAVKYDFDGIPADALDASASLSVLANHTPGLPPLVGEGEALHLTRHVNNGGGDNPIMVSSAPVTPATAVANQMHLNLLFAEAHTFGMAPGADAAGTGELVASWDPAHPPAFRIYFPYFTASSGLPAPLDLTDVLKVGDAGYNAETSAWNIVGTLDPDHPTVTRDDFWQIAIDSASPVPAWLATPTAANTHLFTVTASSSSEPGPFLDLFLLDIVSGLPIDPTRPETELYLQWNGFPGFNDGVLLFTVPKTSLAINSFTGAIKRAGHDVTLELEWQTTGADHCLITGSAAEQIASTRRDTPYRLSITPSEPLLTSYALTAVAGDEVSQVTQPLTARWSFDADNMSVSLDTVLTVQASPDGRQVLGMGRPGVLGVLDADSLTAMFQITDDEGGGVAAFAISSVRPTVYYASLSGAVHGFDLETKQARGVSNPAGLGNPQMRVTPDGSRVCLFDGRRLVVLSSDTLQPVSGSPVHTDDLVTLEIGPVTGRYYMGQTTDFAVIDGDTFHQVEGSPLALTYTLFIAVGGDETSVYALSGTGSPPAISFFLSKIATDPLKIEQSLPVGLGVYEGRLLAALTTSADGALLFLLGLDADFPAHGLSWLAVYDARSMQEIAISRLPSPAWPTDMAMAPDGSRLFMTFGVPCPHETALYAIDPRFS